MNPGPTAGIGAVGEKRPVFVGDLGDRTIRVKRDSNYVRLPDCQTRLGSYRLGPELEHVVDDGVAPRWPGIFVGSWTTVHQISAANALQIVVAGTAA